MRILVVDEEIPYPLNSGKRLRTFNLLKPLAARHEIHFLCRQHQGMEENYPLESLERIGIHPIIVDDPIRKKSGGKFYFALFVNIFSRLPYSVTSHCSSRMIKKIQQLENSLEFDLIHCEWTPYAINILDMFKRKPTLVDAHNVEALIWHRNFKIEGNLLKKAYIYLQWKKMEKFERDIFPKFSRCVAVSEQDASMISDMTMHAKVDVVSNGVDVEYFRQQSCTAKSVAKAQDLIFTGSLDWRPNVDGIGYFLDKIFPLFQQQYPESRFFIVGRNPLSSLKEKVAKFENVILTGTVDDVRPYMCKESVYVVPLRVGGGSRLKILEAFSMEMAVVSTSIGAEGLNVTDMHDIRLADSSVAFFTAIKETIESPTEAKQMGLRGRELVCNSYQWDILASRLEKSWSDAVGERH